MRSKWSIVESKDHHTWTQVTFTSIPVPTTPSPISPQPPKPMSTLTRIITVVAITGHLLIQLTVELTNMCPSRPANTSLISYFHTIHVSESGDSQEPGYQQVSDTDNDLIPIKGRLGYVSKQYRSCPVQCNVTCKGRPGLSGGDSWPQSVQCDYTIHIEYYPLQ